jgi:hypothetical protein
MRRFSKKREKENRQYRKQRIAFLDGLECEAGLKGCTVFATEVHHQKGRIGKNLLDRSTWLGVCRNCHDIIEHEPVMAKERGLSKSRLNAT